MILAPPERGEQMGERAAVVVGIGGTLRPGSSTESALACALAAAERAGARTLRFEGRRIASLPMYNPQDADRAPEAAALLDAVRAADGLLIASPGYHGAVSGLVKNALDYFEDLRTDERPYLEGRAVGCIATAAGWQAAVTTLGNVRTVVHALRGWPTPLGVAVNTTGGVFDRDGACTDERVAAQLELVGQQVTGFALASRS